MALCLYLYLLPKCWQWYDCMFIFTSQSEDHNIWVEKRCTDFTQMLSDKTIILYKIHHSRMVFIRLDIISWVWTLKLMIIDHIICMFSWRLDSLATEYAGACQVHRVQLVLFDSFQFLRCFLFLSFCIFISIWIYSMPIFVATGCVWFLYLKQWRIWGKLDQ